MKTQRLFLALFAVLALRSPAQTVITPERAVELALEKNQYLAAASQRINAAEGLRLQAGLKTNPRLIFQSENTRFTGTPSFQYGQDTDNFGYVSQVFETGGKRESRVDLASSVVRTTQVSLQSQRVQVAARVLTAYWSAVGARQLADVFAKSLELLDRTVQYDRDRLQEGALAEGDLIRVQLEHHQVLISLRNAEQDARRSLQQLFREIGIPEVAGAVLEGRAAELPWGPAEEETAVERRPDVQLAAQSVQQARAALQLQKANAKPDLEVLFGYKRTSGFNTMIAGAQFNLPVRNRNQGNIAAAVADEAAAAAALKATQAAARSEIQLLRGEYEQKRQLVEQTLPAMREQAAENGRIADAVYREGASDLLRLLDAERVRIQTETLYIRTVLDYRLAAVNLRAALGLLP